MNVLVVHNRYRSAQPSGENAVVDDEVALLREHGCTVEQLEMDSDEVATWSAARRAALPARVVWSREGARMVRRAVERFGPDVVHFHNTFPLLSPAAVLAAKASGVPVVLTMHNFRSICANALFLRDGRVCERCLHSKAPVAALRYGCYRDSCLASAPVVAMIAVHRRLGTWTDAVDRVVFPSAFARDKHIAAGWPADKLRVKHNTARALVPVRQGAGDGFVAIARLTHEKGVDTLVDAWREAFPSGDGALTIIGSGDDGAALQARAQGTKGLTFAGALPNVEAMRLLAGARALVVPSRCFEVFPRAIAEAFAMGVPVIASRIGALAEVVSNGRTGFLVDPGSPPALGAVLRHMCDSPALAKQLGTEARRTYEEMFSPQATTETLLGIYEEARWSRRAGSRRRAGRVAEAATDGGIEA